MVAAPRFIFNTVDPGRAVRVERKALGKHKLSWRATPNAAARLSAPSRRTAPWR